MRLWGILSAAAVAAAIVVSAPAAAYAGTLDRRPDAPAAPVVEAPRGEVVLSPDGTVTFSGTATPHSKVLIGTGDPHDIALERTYQDCQNDIPVSGRPFTSGQDVCLEDLVAAGELPKGTRTSGSMLRKPFPDPNVWVWTDASGHFEYDAPFEAGSYDLTAFAESCKQVDVQAGRMLDADFTGEAPAGVGFTCSQSPVTKTVSFSVAASPSSTGSPSAAAARSAADSSAAAAEGAQRSPIAGVGLPVLVSGAGASAVVLIVIVVVVARRRRRTVADD